VASSSLQPHGEQSLGITMKGHAVLLKLLNVNFNIFLCLTISKGVIDILIRLSTLSTFVYVLFTSTSITP